MNIFLIIFLIHKSLGTKRKNAEYDIMTLELVNIDASNDTCTKLIDSNDLTNDELYTKLGKQNDYVNIGKGFFTLFDTYDLTDLQKETYVGLDELQHTSDTNQILTSEQLDAFVNEISEHKYEHYEENCNTIKQDTEKPNNLNVSMSPAKKKMVNTSCCASEKQSNEQVYLDGDLVFVNQEGDSFKVVLQKYIREHIPVSFNDHFLRRIEIINDACLNFDEFKVTCETKFANI